MKVLAFGEILWDVYPEQACIGGAPVNFAAHLARHCETVALLSAVGRDSLGAEALARLAELGVSTRYVAQLEGRKTGRCLVELDEKGVPVYRLETEVAYDCIDGGALAERFDVLYFGTLALRGAHNLYTLRRLLAQNPFSEVFVDMNLRAPFYCRETVAFCAAQATVLKMSAEEISAVAAALKMDSGDDFRRFAAGLRTQYPRLKWVLITLGADGAFGYDCRTGEDCCCPGCPVTVASTVGAGDSFSAAFLHRLSRGDSLRDCLEYATQVASFVVSSVEAIPAYSPQDFR